MSSPLLLDYSIEGELERNVNMDLEVEEDDDDDDMTIRNNSHDQYLTSSNGEDEDGHDDTIPLTTDLRGNGSRCGSWCRINGQHVARAFIIGLTILTSQTLLQTWYAVSPSEFESSVLLGLANGFGDTFDLVTAAFLGKFPYNRLIIHLCIISIGISGTATTLYCSQYELLKMDYIIFIGFCTIGISTCFQPTLMLCNVEDDKCTRINAATFAVFKQMSWATTWIITSGLEVITGGGNDRFFSVVICSFILLSILATLVLFSNTIDPFKKEQSFHTSSTADHAREEEEEGGQLVTPKPQNSEHGSEDSPLSRNGGAPSSASSPNSSPSDRLINRRPINRTATEATVITTRRVSAPPNILHSSSEGATMEVGAAEGVAAPPTIAVEMRRNSFRSTTGYFILVMIMTGSFTFEAAVHSTALELLMQHHWGFSESKSINYFCMIPCIAAVCYPIIPLLTNCMCPVRAKTQVCCSLALLSILNGTLPFIPYPTVATICTVFIVIARTSLLGSMSPFVDRCTKEKNLQAKLIMVQNMTYNAVWSVASIISGFLCKEYIQFTFVTGAAVEFVLFTFCLLFL